MKGGIIVEKKGVIKVKRKGGNKSWKEGGIKVERGYESWNKGFYKSWKEGGIKVEWWYKSWRGYKSMMVLRFEYKSWIININICFRWDLVNVTSTITRLLLE